MTGLGSGPLPSRVGSDTGPALDQQRPDDDFSACLAEALDILADRARRHGLVEVVHLLEVAALAARELAAPPIEGHCQAKRKRRHSRPPSPP